MKIKSETRKKINQLLIFIFWLIMIVTLTLNVINLISPDKMSNNLKDINNNLNSLESIISEAGDVI